VQERDEHHRRRRDRVAENPQHYPRDAEPRPKRSSAITENGRSRGGAQGRRAPAGGHAGERLRPAGQPLRRRLHRLPPMNLARGTIEAGDDGLVARLGSSTIPISDGVSRDRGLEVWLGREVMVGIRPEDLGGPGERGARSGSSCSRPPSIGRSAPTSCASSTSMRRAATATSEAVAEATAGRPQGGGAHHA
jgi:hypothetical protein